MAVDVIWKTFSARRHFLSIFKQLITSNDILQAPSAHHRFPNLNLTSGKTALNEA